jgi:O-acetyl-ADP-ribose deacetylase (regulator of RNase III)
MTAEVKQCFVIMPFGDKRDVDGRTLNFDRIYDDLICPALEQELLKISERHRVRCVRCDKIAQSGWIHRQMISHILDDDIAVVDLSTLNPNVFYELGVRHALRQGVTVLLRRRGTKTPFNVQGFKCIDYDPDDPAALADTRSQIASYVANGLDGQLNDSLVHEVLKERHLVTIAAERVNPEKAYVFRIPKVPRKRIGLLTGDLRHVTGVDIWVNSENTNMQMARYYDRSGSAVIRYFGARRDRAGQVIQDTVAEELSAAMGSAKTVPPGTVLMTTSGELERTNAVKKIFHAAAVQGQPGVGYRPVPDVEMCVREALELADANECAGLGLHSILFPILGTGAGGAELKATFRRLVACTVAYFERRPSSSINTTFFLAFTDQQRDGCLAVLGEGGLEQIVSRRGGK